MKWIVVKEVEGKEKVYFTIYTSAKWTTDEKKAYKFPSSESAKVEAKKYKNIKIEERNK